MDDLTSLVWFVQGGIVYAGLRFLNPEVAAWTFLWLLLFLLCLILVHKEVIKIVRDASHCQGKGYAVHIQVKYTTVLLFKSNRCWFLLYLFKPSENYGWFHMRVG